MLQLRRVGVWLRALPRRLWRAADMAVSGRVLRPWSEPEADRLREASRADSGPLPRAADPVPAYARREAPVFVTRHEQPTDGGPIIVARHENLAPADVADDLAGGAPQRGARDGAAPGVFATAIREAAAPAGMSAATAREAAASTRRAVADLGRQIGPRAVQLGRRLAPQAVQLGRRLAPLARQGATATGRGLLSAGRRVRDLRPLLGLLGRFFAAVGTATCALVGGAGRLSAALGNGLADGLARHRAVLFGLFTRALWWGALVLLVLGGQALVEIHGHAPLDREALPAFAIGLGVCSLLVMIAAQARLRWAALVLGFGHGGLLALVWVVSAALGPRS